tara:strand:+ start:600 stop:923 length:324 start_codon:yes stop_codon:yes gene_type:complete
LVEDALSSIEFVWLTPSPLHRVHQFDKIEQFVVTEDDLEVSSAEQTRMKETAEEFYKSLGIDFRTIVLVSGELNDAAIKKYDLEGEQLTAKRSSLDEDEKYIRALLN